MLVAAFALAFLVRSASLSAMPSAVLPATPAAPAATVASSALRVLVRVDTRGAEQHLRLADLIHNVRTIWKPYADIVFADAADLGGDGYDDEIQLVISGRPGAAGPGGSALGWITFVAPGRPANYVTVSVATARNLMAGENWLGRRFELLPPALAQKFVNRAVSWSAAHEIGHFLLRTREHSAGGLMKAQLSAGEVMRNDSSGALLEPHEVEVLRWRAAHAGQLTKLQPESPDDQP